MIGSVAIDPARVWLPRKLCITVSRSVKGRDRPMKDGQLQMNNGTNMQKHAKTTF